ncbi:MAG: electron transfer flavoprotein subunit beta/FixA family protein [Deltaproteobacteria bacterium]|uniref:Electron transfer flavoprotein subunit beta/FixA family protein n=1 Tax=Candidatus Desulfacyla euxinica TaxID=2841693 RepID=A0A8J6MYD6_9DELT|nr:electron transfer flavoprotein subunit beta/FixA family protein [Candidatus Desulfacyla euxinica]
MKIIVTVKQVPDTQEVKIDPKTGTLIREGVPSIINPEDKNAIEEALRIKESNDDVEVTVLSMGPPQAESALREALAMGADRAVLVSDRAFAGADTLATSYMLSKAIKKIKEYDLILRGRQAIDGDTGQVGPQLAEVLDLPQATYAEQIDIQGNRVTVKSNFDSVTRVIEMKTPALITVTKQINKPRFKTMNGVLRAFRDKEVVTWTKEDLKLNPMRIGINGSPTWVRKTFIPSHNREGLVIEKQSGEIAEDILNFILEKTLFRF